MTGRVQRAGSLLALSAGLAFTMAAGAPAMDNAAIDERAADWQPTARERQWEQIGWAGGLKRALEVAKQSGRPVFLFTHDGRLNVGRC